MIPFFLWSNPQMFTPSQPNSRFRLITVPFDLTCVICLHDLAFVLRYFVKIFCSCNVFVRRHTRHNFEETARPISHF